MNSVAFDIGTGTGVLAAVLARRGNCLLIYNCNFHVLSHLLLIYMCKLHWNLNTMSGILRVIGTDIDTRAVSCANDNINRLGLRGRVQVHQADLFPPNGAKAALIVCNPPWIPAKASSPLERAIFDFNSQMLIGFLRGLKERLLPGGEGWLILSGKLLLIYI